MKKEIQGILRELNDEIPDDMQVDLLEEGLIDSFDIVNIVSALEDHFGIEISAEAIVPQNFDSVENISRLIDECLSKRGPNEEEK